MYSVVLTVSSGKVSVFMISSVGTWEPYACQRGVPCSHTRVVSCSALLSYCIDGLEGHGPSDPMVMMSMLVG